MKRESTKLLSRLLKFVEVALQVISQGDRFTIKSFYIELKEGESWVCIHALTSMISLLSPFIHGISAKLLDIGDKDGEGYLQCPDLGKPTHVETQWYSSLSVGVSTPQAEISPTSVLRCIPNPYFNAVGVFRSFYSFLADIFKYG